MIGAGFGGLALAIRLQSGGFDTTLIEKRDKPGGRAYVYEDQGFTFDAGPTVITDPSALEELFALGGGRLADYVELIPVDPFYRLSWEDGSTFDYVNDQGELDRQIAARNPADVAGYRRFLAYSEEVFAEGYIQARRRPISVLLADGAGRAVSRAAAGVAQRLRHRLALHRRRAHARSVLLPLAAGRR